MHEEIVWYQDNEECYTERTIGDTIRASGLERSLDSLSLVDWVLGYQW